MTDKTKFNGWKPKIITKTGIELIFENVSTGVKIKMLEININKNGSVEHINGLPKGYGYFVKRIK
tara:strand:- start:167 stop:361 length:195 start_codon:yes stop_codon:yes gene_type:complete